MMKMSQKTQLKSETTKVRLGTKIGSLRSLLRNKSTAKLTAKRATPKSSPFARPVIVGENMAEEAPVNKPRAARAMRALLREGRKNMEE
jgi:hypothetical protein